MKEVIRNCKNVEKKKFQKVWEKIERKLNEVERKSIEVSPYHQKKYGRWSVLIMNDNHGYAWKCWFNSGLDEILLIIIMVTKYSIEVNHGLEKNCGFSSGSTIEVNHLLKIVLAPD